MKAGSISHARMLYALLGMLTAGVVAFAVFQPIKVLPRSTLAPGFALTDVSGAHVNSETLRGRLVVYHYALQPTPAPLWLDRWRPWLALTFALIVVSYGPQLFIQISQSQFGSPGFRPW